MGGYIPSKMCPKIILKGGVSDPILFDTFHFNLSNITMSERAESVRFVSEIQLNCGGFLLATAQLIFFSIAAD